MPARRAAAARGATRPPNGSLLPICRRWLTPHPPTHPHAAPEIVYYTADATNDTYAFVSSVVTMSESQKFCNSLGGHLVSWKGMAEQVEVEQYYVNYGVLLPSYHKGYWTGLTAESWPNFNWIDKTAGRVDYTHWASFEPNNMNNMCGIGNYSAEYDGAWGWSDEPCMARFPFICKLMGPRNLTRQSNVTGNVFTLYTAQATQAEAEQVCRSQGGHLASFTSLDEQVEMEFAFVNEGYLLAGARRPRPLRLHEGCSSELLLPLGKAAALGSTQLHMLLAPSCSQPTTRRTGSASTAVTPPGPSSTGWTAACQTRRRTPTRTGAS
jgi:hypothetical protein